jgi:hypothetical protein
MVDKLQELVDAGPDPTRGLQHLVLARFHLISRARARLRKWPEIAEALDMPADRAKALAASFYRVAKKVKAGDLEPPESKPATAAPAATGTTAKPRTTAATGTPAATVAPGYHPSGRRLAPGEKLRDDGLDF